MSLFIKRTFDIVMSSIALLILSPIFLLTMIGIKLSSKGGVFYKASRVTINGNTFGMYKFRSMHEAKNAVEKSFIADGNRIFPFGSFLRKSKIDELPQLINILLGHMSIVGPRPASTANVDELYTGKYKDIQKVRPGLTSYASLYDYKHGELFISDNDEYIRKVLPVKMELELYYVHNWNVFVDLKLIFGTVITIIEIVFGKKFFKYTKLEQSAIEKVHGKETVREVV